MKKGLAVLDPMLADGIMAATHSLVFFRIQVWKGLSFTAPF